MHQLIRDERGFTLIELLVVILIVGILAAIALPTFLGQQRKAQDTDAKANARQMVTHVEACFADGQDYTDCRTSTMSTTGLPVGSGQGQVDVTASDVNGYTIVATSKSGNIFKITKTLTTGMARTCTAVVGNAGCKSGTW